MALRPLLANSAFIVGAAVAVCVGTGWLPAYAAPSSAGYNQGDLGQAFRNDVDSCIAGTIGTTVEAGENKAKDFVIDHFLPESDRQVVKNSLRVSDTGNGGLRLVARLANTDGSDSGQVVEAGFSVGDYIMSLLSAYGPPPVADAANVESWMMPCLQAAFILDGQAGSALGQAMHDAVYPPNLEPASTLPASEVPDVGPIPIPFDTNGNPVPTTGNH